ncbi:MAG: hypothetical protein O7F09_00020 [Chloroflexi bacterium]|nr:hypothetical protein [Chloroflexota bacterium]
MTHKPRYYLAVFGDPTLPDHVTVEEGHFGVDSGWPPALTEGDRVLLYCTGSYLLYPKSVPGVGVVEEVDCDNRRFFFDYKGLDKRVPLDELRLAFQPDDRVKLANIRFDSFWLFEIAAKSYRNVMGLARGRS